MLTIQTDCRVKTLRPEQGRDLARTYIVAITQESIEDKIGYCPIACRYTKASINQALVEAKANNSQQLKEHCTSNFEP